jgi:hypothetical protein
MSKKKPTPKKVWQPLVRDPDWFRDQRRVDTIKMVRAQHPEITDAQVDALMPDETWGNDRYTVNVHFLDGDRDGFVEVGVHNHNRTPHVPWRHLQQIKNEVMGADREAVQLFPADDRLVDTANEFWLYVYPVGKAPMRKREVRLGMDHGRNVAYDAPEGFGRSRQSPEMEVGK